MTARFLLERTSTKDGVATAHIISVVDGPGAGIRFDASQINADADVADVLASVGTTTSGARWLLLINTTTELASLVNVADVSRIEVVL